MAAAKHINAKELERSLRDGSLKRAYLFLGEEEGHKENVIGRIASLLESDGGPGSAAVERFHAGSGDLMAAAGFALTMSMFQPRKLAVIYEADSIQANKQNRALLEEILAGAPDGAVIILAAAQNQVPKVFNAEILALLQTVRFWRLFESDMASHLRDSFRRGKLAVDDEAVTLLLRLTGRDLRKADQAVEKLIMSGEPRVTAALVASHIMDERDVTIFEFLDALFLRKPAAFTLLKRLMDDGVPPLVVLAMITRQCESLEKFHRLAKGPKGADEIAHELGIRERNAEAFLAYTRGFDARDTGRAFTAILRAEGALKGPSASKAMMANPLFDLVSDMVLERNSRGA